MVWSEDNQEAVAIIKTSKDELSIMADDLNQQGLDNLLESQVLAKLMTLWIDFLNHLRYTNGELSAFWMSYGKGGFRPTPCFS